MENEKQPVLSVIVPVHNVEAFVEKCVDSLLAQTIVGSMEIILVENGSTDGSLAVCKQLAARSECVKVVVSEVVGPSAARNFGLRHARGIYVGFVDSDDTVDPEMFETLVAEKERYSADMAYCNFMLEFDDGTCEYPFTDTGCVTVVEVPGAVADIITETSTSSPCVRVFDRSFFAGHSFPEGVFYEDHATTYRWMSEMKKVVHVDRAFYHYFMRKGSTVSTTAGNPRKIMDYFRADLGRVEFIKRYDGFSRSQRNACLRRVAKNMVQHLRAAIFALGEGHENDSLLLEMRVWCVPLAFLSPFIVGWDVWLRLQRVKYFWRSFYRHYTSRLCQVKE